MISSFPPGWCSPHNCQSLCTHVKAWVKDLWWAWCLSKPSPWWSSHLLPLTPACCLGSSLTSWKSLFRQDLWPRPGHATWLHHQCGQEWVWMCTGQSLLHFLFWPKAPTVRVQVLCGQRARSSQHILGRANQFSGSARAVSLITYHCPTERSQRHVLLGDLHVTCRVTCSAVKTSTIILPAWKMSKQSLRPLRDLLPGLPTPKKAHA